MRDLDGRWEAMEVAEQNNEEELEKAHQDNNWAEAQEGRLIGEVGWSQNGGTRRIQGLDGMQEVAVEEQDNEEEGERAQRDNNWAQWEV